MGKHLLAYCTLFAVLSLPVFGQTTDNTDEDPFVNNPFFSRPLTDLLKPTTPPADTIAVEPEKQKTSSSSKTRETRRFVNRIHNEGIDFGGAFESGPYSSSALYASYPNLPMVHFNRVNGLFLGIKKERMQWYNSSSFLGISNFQPHGMIGYSFGQDEWQYLGGLEKFIGRQRRVLIGAEIYDATTTEDYWRTGLLETSLTSFFAGYDFLDYHKQEGWGMYFLARSRQFFEGGVSYNENKFNNLASSSDYHLFGKNHHYRINPPIDFNGIVPVDTARITNLTFSGQYNPKLLMLSRYFTFSASGKVEVSNPSLASTDYSYKKYSGELAAYVNFEPGSILKYRIMAGSITGDAPLFKEFQLGGPGSMRALPYKSMPFGFNGANKMILSTAELQFGSSWGQDGWIDLDDFYLSFFLDSGWVNDHTGSNKLIGDGFENFHVKEMEHNGGIGLGSNTFRAELAWDLRHTSRSPVLWLRFNPTF
jgi:hypothetical protein